MNTEAIVADVAFIVTEGGAVTVVEALAFDVDEYDEDRRGFDVWESA